MADTAVTVQTVIDNSIARAKDDKKTQWTDEQLLIFLKKAHDYIHKLLIRSQNELAITTVTVSMVASTREYALSDNLPDFWGMVENGVYFSTEPLTPVTVEDAVRYGTTTTNVAPTGYYIRAGYLGVVETPTVTSVTAYPTLTCRYYKKNTELTLASNMPYNNLFNEPMSSFMDHVAVLKTTAPTDELTAIYNALEESALAIVSRRVPT